MTNGGNMRIWSKVEKTDPKHTRPIAFGQRKFTTIDAMYVIKRATETLGPVGIGWGYDVEYMVTAEYVAAQVRIWHEEHDNWYGPVMGMAKLKIFNKKAGKDLLDEDAGKKAMTDALTKALSHLGFGADVFLGLYDDNRYVETVDKEFRQEEQREKKKKLEDVVLPTSADSELGTISQNASEAQDLDSLMLVYQAGVRVFQKMHLDAKLTNAEQAAAIEAVKQICGERRNDLENQEH
jgi:hypothetical protein